MSKLKPLWLVAKLKILQSIKTKFQKTAGEQTFRARYTYTTAAHGYDDKGLQDACSSHNPGHSQKQDDPQDILKAGQVDAHERPHLWTLNELRHKAKTSSHTLDKICNNNRIETTSHIHTESLALTL